MLSLFVVLACVGVTCIPYLLDVVLDEKRNAPEEEFDYDYR